MGRSRVSDICKVFACGESVVGNTLGILNFINVMMAQCIFRITDLDM